MFKRNKILNKLAPKIIYILILVWPRIVGANLLVTEIAWMGTEVSSNDEWIELYNNSDESIELIDWELSAGDGSPTIPLNGVIGPNEYVVLERTDDTTIPNIEAFYIYTGALSNDGEFLSLKNQNGEVEQSLNFISGWPAGDSNTKDTMQLYGDSWITASPTPKQETEGVELEPEVLGESTKTEKIVPSKKKIYSGPQVKLSFSKNNYVGSKILFEIETKNEYGEKMYGGRYVMTMGDGSVLEFFPKKEIDYDIFYTYLYPGEYKIYLEFYKTVFETTKPSYSNEYSIKVIGGSVFIDDVLSDSAIKLKNISNIDVDLSDFKIGNEVGDKFIIPRNTIIASGKEIIIPFNIHGLKNILNKKIFLYSENNRQIDNYPKYKEEKIEETPEEDLIPDYYYKYEEDPEIKTEFEKEKRNEKDILLVSFGLIILAIIISIFLFRKRSKEKVGFELVD